MRKRTDPHRRTGGRLRGGVIACVRPLCLLGVLVLAPPESTPAATYAAGAGTFSAVGGAPAGGGTRSVACAGQFSPGTSKYGLWLLDSGILAGLRRPTAVSLTAEIPEEAPENTDLTVALRVNAVVPVAAVRACWRACGEPGYATVPMYAQGGATYAATIPAADVSLRGLDVYYEVVADGRTFHSPANSPQAYPWRIPVVVKESDGGGDLSTGAATYRMLSLPAACVDGSARVVLEDDLGAPDRGVWRFGRWNPATGRYREHGVDGVETFEPGRAFWLITDRGRQLDFSGRTCFPSTDSLSAVTLQPGWNQIGNPYAFPIDLGALWIRSAGVTFSMAEAAAARIIEASPLHEYAGTGYATSARFEAWTGYFMANLRSQAVELLIPMREAPAEAAPVIARASEQEIIDATSGFTARLEWLALLTASAGDQRCTLAIASSSVAAEGWDPLDQLAPPPPLAPGVWLHSSNDRLPSALAALCRDVRPVRNPGECWEITLGTEAASPVDLHWEPVIDLPADFEARLADPGTGDWVDLSAGFGRVDAAGAAGYRLLVGRRDWLESQVGGALALDRDGLALDGSSPFRSSTRVCFVLTEPTSVSLSVCDLTGRVVKQLTSGQLSAGGYSIPWDGRTESGTPAAAGVYFLHLTAGRHQSTVRTVLIR